jgi:5-methylcytosine-specific restriction endonuclease McrA
MVPTENSYPEGAGKQVVVNKYERDPKARKGCLKHHGYNCAVCGFSFEGRYGLLGREYIHVHHLVELSMVGSGYEVNPKKDLIPICPNCHAMIHRSGPGRALTPEELKQQLRPAEGLLNGAPCTRDCRDLTKGPQRAGAGNCRVEPYWIKASALSRSLATPQSATGGLWSRTYSASANFAATATYFPFMRTWSVG